jgi:hypothetical protein
MTAMTAEFVPVTSLHAGDMVRYAGTDYQVADVMPVARYSTGMSDSSGHVVVGYVFADGVRGDRVALIYACADSVAELTGGAP